MFCEKKFAISFGEKILISDGNVVCKSDTTPPPPLEIIVLI
jgi:hypothetical protein